MNLSTTALKQQLFRYAQDLQDLMQQQSALQQRCQLMLQAMGRGERKNDLLLGLCTESVDLYLMTDPQGSVKFSSQAVDKTLARAGRALKGQSIGRLMPLNQQSSLQVLLASLAGNTESGAIQQRQLLLCDDTQAEGFRVYEALIMPVKERDRTTIVWLLGNQIEAIASALDIQKSFPFFGQSDEGLLITDPAGDIQAINPAFSRITGYSAADVIGQNPRLLRSGLQDADHYQSMWRQLLARGSWSGQVFNRRKNGQIFFQWMTIKVVKTSNGETVSYVAAFADMSPRENDSKQLARLAFHDPLTGLPNRRLLETRMTQALIEAEQRSVELVVLYIDLNGFKTINDELGREVGDLVLQAVGTNLQTAVRRGDVVARVGGDEFVILLQAVDSREVIEGIANYIHLLLDAPIYAGEHALTVQANIGCARYPQDGDTMTDLLKRADAAMYASKQFGLRLCFYETGTGADTLSAD